MIIRKIIVGSFLIASSWLYSMETEDVEDLPQLEQILFNSDRNAVLKTLLNVAAKRAAKIDFSKDAWRTLQIRKWIELFDNVSQAADHNMLKALYFGTRIAAPVNITTAVVQGKGQQVYDNVRNGNKTLFLSAVNSQMKEEFISFLAEYQHSLNHNVLEAIFCLKCLPVFGNGGNVTLRKLLMTYLIDYFTFLFVPLDPLLTIKNNAGYRACDYLPHRALVPATEYKKVMPKIKYKLRYFTYRSSKIIKRAGYIFLSKLWLITIVTLWYINYFHPEIGYLSDYRRLRLVILFFCTPMAIMLRPT